MRTHHASCGAFADLRGIYRDSEDIRPRVAIPRPTHTTVADRRPTDKNHSPRIRWVLAVFFDSPCPGHQFSSSVSRMRR